MTQSTSQITHESTSQITRRIYDRCPPTNLGYLRSTVLGYLRSTRVIREVLWAISQVVGESTNQPTNGTPGAFSDEVKVDVKDESGHNQRQITPSGQRSKTPTPILCFEMVRQPELIEALHVLEAQEEMVNLVALERGPGPAEAAFFRLTEGGPGPRCHCCGARILRRETWICGPCGGRHHLWCMREILVRDRYRPLCAKCSHIRGVECLDFPPYAMVATGVLARAHGPQDEMATEILCRCPDDPVE